MLNGLWEIPMKQITLDSNYIEDFKKYIFDKYGYIISFKKIISEIEHVYSHFKMKLIVMDFIKCDDIKNTGILFLGFLEEILTAMLFIELIIKYLNCLRV